MNIPAIASACCSRTRQELQQTLASKLRLMPPNAGHDATAALAGITETNGMVVNARRSNHLRSQRTIYLGRRKGHYQ